MGLRTASEKWSALDYDVIIVHSPHWKTRCGHHLGVDLFKSKSVDPVFPHLFRYHYDLKVDVELPEQIAAAASDRGLVTKMMRNPHLEWIMGLWFLPFAEATVGQTHRGHFVQPCVL